MIDLSYLKSSTGNDFDVIKQLLDLFKEQLPELKEGIKKAFENQNLNELKELSHKAKNSFQILGVSDQAQNLKEMEILAGKGAKKEEIQPLFNSFWACSKTIVAEIDRLNLK